MLYALMVVAVGCMGLSAALFALLRRRSYGWLFGINFFVTFTLVFLASQFWTQQEVTTGQALLASLGFAVVMTLLLAAIRAVDKTWLEPAARRSSLTS